MMAAMARTMDKLAKTLGKILKARGMQARLHEYRIGNQWDRTVGPAIARHAQPQGLRAGKLALVVDSPAWMQQLSLMKPELIEKLNRDLGRETVKDITLKLGEVASGNKSSPEEELPRPALSAEEREKIEGSVKDIAEPSIREAIRRLFEKDVQSRKRTDAGQGTKK
jgi:predicted nucleic acid-binding Zn ribbon protein